MRHKQASSVSFQDHHDYEASEQVNGENICLQPDKYIVGKRTKQVLPIYINSVTKLVFWSMRCWHALVSQVEKA